MRAIIWAISFYKITYCRRWCITYTICMYYKRRDNQLCLLFKRRYITNCVCTVSNGITIMYTCYTRRCNWSDFYYKRRYNQSWLLLCSITIIKIKFLFRPIANLLSDRLHKSYFDYILVSHTCAKSSFYLIYLPLLIQPAKRNCNSSM